MGSTELPAVVPPVLSANGVRAAAPTAGDGSPLKLPTDVSNGQVQGTISAKKETAQGQLGSNGCAEVKDVEGENIADEDETDNEDAIEGVDDEEDDDDDDEEAEGEDDVDDAEEDDENEAGGDEVEDVDEEAGTEEDDSGDDDEGEEDDEEDDDEEEVDDEEEDDDDEDEQPPKKKRK